MSEDSGMPGPGVPGIRVSVIVPTFNRRDLLREAIESLWKQTLSSDLYEIIVVDNCSTDHTAEMVSQMQEKSPCRLVYHCMPENRGPARSRNVGVSLAQASILAFTDSDCWVSPQWLELGLKAFDARPDLCFVTGSTVNKPGQATRFFSIGTPLAGENPAYPTANIFYRKSAYLELGGFDETWLGSLAFEASDTDLAWRAIERGYTYLFDENMIVYHEIARVSAVKWLLANARLIHLPDLVHKHPGLRQRLLWWGPFSLMENFLFYVGMLGLILAAAVHPAFLSLVIPFIYRAARVEPNSSPKKLILLPARVFFLGLRQAAICAFLLFGSVRARTLLL